MRFVFAFLLTFLPAFSQTSQKKPVTIAALLSHPGYRESISPVWSPDGRSFAYIRRGAVYRYDVSTRKSKEWFQLAKLESEAAPVDPGKAFGWQNRRVSSGSLQWFPDNRDLFVEAGGDLFLVHPDGAHRQLTKTDFAEEDPQLSRDGRSVLYRSRSNLFLLDLSSGQPRQLTSDGTPTLMNGQLDWVYPEELDLGQAMWWSPDSQRIAFLQFDTSAEFVYPQTDLTGERALSEPERYPQTGTPNARVKLAVLSVPTGQISWMQIDDPADSLLARVIWSPDSSLVAVERLNRVQNRLDLLFCDPSTGAVRNVLREESKTWINFTDNLYFLRARPEFLWTSERGSGFRHIYRYSNQGHLLATLTSGDWEVRKIEGVDEPRSTVYFSSSETSPLESQLFSVSFDGGRRARLTPEPGTHRVEANNDGSYFLDEFSNDATPPSQSLKASSGATLAVLQEPDRSLAREFELLPSEILTLAAEDGTPLYGRLVKPAGFQPGVKYPLIVQVYGGPGVQTVRNDWEGLDMAQVFAHHGYLVWQMDNRGSSGRGHKFEEPIFRELGAREVLDQKRGVESLIQKGFVDPARVGITGWSYGGFMTLHCLLFAPDVFKVGVAGAPVTDWHNYDTIYTERYMDLPANNAERYIKSSNVLNASKFEGNLLILHNFEDDNVLFQNTLQMAAALESAGKTFFMQIYPQKTHGVFGAYRKTLLESQLSFFDRYLKP